MTNSRSGKDKGGPFGPPLSLEDADRLARRFAQGVEIEEHEPWFSWHVYTLEDGGSIIVFGRRCVVVEHHSGATLWYYDSKEWVVVQDEPLLEAVHTLLRRR